MSKDTRDRKQETNRTPNEQHSDVSVDISHSVRQEATSGATSGLEEKVEELTNDLQRVHAEFANFRRRSDDERGAFLDLAKQDVILQLLPVLDNIGRALTHIPEELSDNQWAKGVGQIAKQAEAALTALGVESFGKVGDSFDPNFHEAIAYEIYDSGSKELQQGASEFVSEVLQSGYKIGGKVIRHAMVKVGRK